MTKQFDLELMLNELFGESDDEAMEDISVLSFPLCPAILDYVCCTTSYTGYSS